MFTEKLAKCGVAIVVTLDNSDNIHGGWLANREYSHPKKND
jgi:hypothetical protein